MTLRKRGNNNPNRGRAKRKRVAPTPVGDPSLARQRRTASALAQRAVSNALAQRMALAALGARAMTALTDYNRPKGLGLSHEPMLIRNRNEVVGNKRLAVYPDDPSTWNKIPKKRAIRVGRHWFDAKALRRVVQASPANPRNPLTREPLPNAVVAQFSASRIPFDLWDPPATSDFERDRVPPTTGMRKLWSAARLLSALHPPGSTRPVPMSSIRTVQQRYNVVVTKQRSRRAYNIELPASNPEHRDLWASVQYGDATTLSLFQEVYDEGGMQVADEIRWDDA